jgi:hypothetical protein
MSHVAEEHVHYQIANAPIREYPYPHICVDDLFPADFYARLRANWPDSSAFMKLGDTGRVPEGAYAERFVLPLTPSDIAQLVPERRPFWNEFAAWFTGQRFLTAMIDKFIRYVEPALGDQMGDCTFSPDVLIVRDLPNFKIGPHTDAPHRLVTMLFYCPDDDSRKHLGTSIYVPRDPAFRCAGGPHYPHDMFHLVKTMEYKPNSLFAFYKNDYSFHGVEPIHDQNVQRDLMLYDVRVKRPQRAAAGPAPAPGIGVQMLKGMFGGSRK